MDYQGRVAAGHMVFIAIPDFGAKHDLQLVEFGPGRGTLMDDILRVRYSF
jgi:SAM-dependent MidA family methyltransferase